jgi:hypothetical protein
MPKRAADNPSSRAQSPPSHPQSPDPDAAPGLDLDPTPEPAPDPWIVEPGAPDPGALLHLGEDAKPTGLLRMGD